MSVNISFRLRFILMLMGSLIAFVTRGKQDVNVSCLRFPLSCLIVSAAVIETSSDYRTERKRGGNEGQKLVPEKEVLRVQRVLTIAARVQRVSPHMTCYHGMTHSDFSLKFKLVRLHRSFRSFETRIMSFYGCRPVR